MQVNISYAQTNIVCEVRKSRNSTICDLISSVLITIYRVGCQRSRLCIAFHGKIQYNIMIVSDRQYQDERKSVNIDIYSERMRQQE